MRSLSVSIILLVPFTSFTVCQQGKDCGKDEDCNAHQTCHFGYCRCDFGYVKNIHHCFPLRKYGQNCEFEEQCNDFRMVCKTRPNEINKRCLCGSFLEWSSSLGECGPVSNFTEMVGSLEEDTAWQDKLHEDGQRIFFNIAAAGIFVAAFGLLCILAGITYGCCFKGLRDSRIRKNKKTDEENITVQEVAGEGTGGTYIPVATDVTSGATTFLAVA